MKALATVIGIAGLLLAPAVGYAACDYAWDGSTDTDWNDATNWTVISGGNPCDGKYPGQTAGDTATIDNSQSASWPSMSSDICIDGLTVGDSATLATGSYVLYVDGTFTVNSGSTITISGSTGGIDAEQVVINGNSTVTVSMSSTGVFQTAAVSCP